MYWIVAVLALLVIVYWYGVKDYAVLKNVPLSGPKPWPYVGNLLDVLRQGSLNKTMQYYFKRYGRVYKMCLGKIPSIVVSDPEIIKEIFVKEFHKFPNFSPFLKLNPPLDSAVAFARGATWNRIRSALTPTFSTGKLKLVVPIMEDATATLRTKLEKIASSGKSVNTFTLFSHFALDVIMSSAFGYKSNIQTNPDPEFVEKARAVLVIPLWKRFFTMFPFSGYFSRFISLLPNTDYFIQKALKMITARAKEGSQGRRDLVELMLEAHGTMIDGVPKLSYQEIAAQSFTFLVAGFETTGNTLSNTSHVLATHPEIQDKLIKTLDEARANRGDTPLYEFVQSLAYLDQVLCEVLRLYAPSFLLLRECEEECSIKGVRFPKGVDVVVPVTVLHRDPEAWENPEKFDPEAHFSPEAKANRHPYSYLPFGGGPRQCIGMRFALLEIKIALISVLEKFRFERAPETRSGNLEMVGNAILRPKDPIILKIRQR